MKQDKDQSTTSDRSPAPASNRSVPASGGSGGEKPKGTAAPVQFPTLSLPKAGGAIPWYFILLFIALILSCSSNSLSPADYLKWMAEHRAQFSASQQQGDISAALIYPPADWLSINEAFERHYGAAPNMDFMLGFDQKTSKHFDRMLIFYDRMNFNSTIQLTIPNKKITNVPNLKL